MKRPSGERVVFELGAFLLSIFLLGVAYGLACLMRSNWIASAAWSALYWIWIGVPVSKWINEKRKTFISRDKGSE